MYDFHTHTFLSDGVLAPIELIRRAVVNGYKVLGITDHVGPGNMENVVKSLTKDCNLANSKWDIQALPGVELTHVPIEEIDRLALEARLLGARIVNVHGETITEPVEKGTNLAAVSSKNVDLLAHPGLIDIESASIAATNDVFLEISARRGHAFTNGHVARMARCVGAKMILDSDAHLPDELLTNDFAMKVALGAGLSKHESEYILNVAPKTFLKKIESSMHTS